jgi:ABC-type transport system involved in multi-copper enzyme maturation permease subunit
MAVHSHAFRPYSGPRTPVWARPLVLTRYALRDAFGQKKTIALLVLSAIPTLAAAVIIYLHHNLEAVKILEIPVDALIKIDSKFFFRILGAQTLAAFLLTVVAGPRMLVADLRDNALPLYLSRPLSRFEYVLGKAVALATLGSLVTWVPGLVLVALQVSLTGSGWLGAHWWVPLAIFVGSWAAIVLFSLICLAIAAVVRRKAAAEGAVVAFFFVLPLVGQVINNALRVEWGAYLQVPAVIASVWIPLFRLDQPANLTLPGAIVTLALFLVGACLVLERRVRAWEIVR